MHNEEAKINFLEINGQIFESDFSLNVQNHFKALIPLLLIVFLINVKFEFHLDSLSSLFLLMLTAGRSVGFWPLDDARLGHLQSLVWAGRWCFVLSVGRNLFGSGLAGSSSRTSPILTFLCWCSFDWGLFVSLLASFLLLVPKIEHFKFFRRGDRKKKLLISRATDRNRFIMRAYSGAKRFIKRVFGDVNVIFTDTY